MKEFFNLIFTSFISAVEKTPGIKKDEKDLKISSVKEAQGHAWQEFNVFLKNKGGNEDNTSRGDLLTWIDGYMAGRIGTVVSAVKALDKSPTGKTILDYLEARGHI